MANDVQVSRELFLNNTPMLDTRAPVEFGKGAFPGRGQFAVDDGCRTGSGRHLL